jgi:hypothetical protein
MCGSATPKSACYHLGYEQQCTLRVADNPARISWLKKISTILCAGVTFIDEEITGKPENFLG